MVAAPLLDSSSGCACTAMSRRGPELCSASEDMAVAAVLPVERAWDRSFGQIVYRNDGVRSPRQPCSFLVNTDGPHVLPLRFAIPSWWLPVTAPVPSS